MMLSVPDLERVFDELAAAIDGVGAQHEALFLTKLALVLANRAGDAAAVRDAIALARQQLDDASPGAAPGIPVRGLHHFAWRCRDAEETRHFYEDLLGLPLAHVIKADNVPSTGEHCPYVHIFFEMRDGSYVAFFDLGDDTASAPSPNTPAWVNHIALELDDVDAVRAAKARLEAAGVEVLGVTDHHIIQSIYFFDPNGLRVELTARSVPQAYMDAAKLHARAAVDAWTAEKSRRRTLQA
jgi:catechol 2,3-dioxygenase-like lactoylglutathione lyase family enzyme